MKPWQRTAWCLASLWCVACESERSQHGDNAPAATQRGEANAKKVLFYKSPMDPSFISQKPGKDAMGMDLVPVYEGDPAANLDRIEVKGAMLQRLGVRVAKVERGKLTRIVRALGRVDFDEERIATVNMKFDGWIEKLYVDETGQKVARGAPLFEVYSPELLATQKEYLQILGANVEGPHSAHLVRSARDRLLQFDVPEGFVERLEKRREAQRRVLIRAPAAGYVVHKTAFEGTFVKKGANLFTIADLNALWVLADVFEIDAPWVVAGQKATVELDYLPGNMQEATVDYVYPTLNERSRTLQVRLTLPNPNIALKPGMFATVRIHTHPVGNALLVPSEAVIHSGERNLAFVQTGDGLFEPRELTLGVRGDDRYQVLAGLQEGEWVVVSGEFLLDSESRLKEAVKKLLGTNLPVPHAGNEAEHEPAAPQGMKAMPGMRGDAGAVDASGQALPAKQAPGRPEPSTQGHADHAESHH